MTVMIVGLVLFFGIHLVPVAQPLRARLVARLGDGPYRAVFSVVAGLGLVSHGHHQVFAREMCERRYVQVRLLLTKSAHGQLSGSRRRRANLLEHEWRQSQIDGQRFPARVRLIRRWAEDGKGSGTA